MELIRTQSKSGSCKLPAQACMGKRELTETQMVLDVLTSIRSSVGKLELSKLRMVLILVLRVVDMIKGVAKGVLGCP